MPTAQQEQRRVGWKLFVRPQEVSEFYLSQRNLSLLAHIARYRLISSDGLARLDGGSVQNAKRELRNLWEHGYVVRPAGQLRTVAITGPQPMVYGLSNKGARLLREHGHLIDLGLIGRRMCDGRELRTLITRSHVRGLCPRWKLRRAAGRTFL